MSEVIDILDDEDEGDIFVLKQIKPVNKLTLQQALIIKHTVLMSRSCQRNKKKKKKKKEKSSGSSEQQKKKTDGPIKKFLTESKTKKNSANVSSSSENEGFKKKDKPKVKKNEQNCTIENEEYPPSECEIDKSTDISFTESVLSETSIEKSKNIFSKRKRDEFSKKNVELPSDNSSTPKKIKCLNAPEQVSQIPTKDVKQFHDSFVESPVNKSPVKDKLNRESVFDGSQYLPNVSDIKNGNPLIENIKPSQLENGQFTEKKESNDFKLKSFTDNEDAIRGTSDLVSFTLKKIIKDETLKQIQLQSQNTLNGRTIEKLFSAKECEIFENFFHLEDKPCNLFVRMLSRKRCWHRVSKIMYQDIDEELEKHFIILKKTNFVDTNIEDEDLTTQLSLLMKTELLILCRAFNIFSKHTEQKKCNLIKSLIENCKTQRSVVDAFKKPNVTYREDILRSELLKNLGMCIKINSETYTAFRKIIVLSSFAHYWDEEDERLRNELSLHIKVQNNIVEFPKYKVNPFVVFDNKNDFEEYEVALEYLNQFEKAVLKKNYDDYMNVVNAVKVRFENILQNYEYHERFLALPSFLKKFSAGSVYAKILTKYCQTFKTRTEPTDRLETVKLLLEQKLFQQGKRGSWYEILLMSLETKREINKTAEIIISSLQDPFVNEVEELSLQLRGQGILKKKKQGIVDLRLRDALKNLCVLKVEEPSSIEIKGKALGQNYFGVKSVYVQTTKYGKKYTSVEERAIGYYKCCGFTNGYHVEGYIIHSIYFLLFFDIIYELSPRGVFLSPFQQIPLDFHSSAFYFNRKDQIDKLLTEMLTWDDEKVESTIKNVYMKNFNTICIISWKEEFTPELFCEVIKCITMPILVLIFQRLSQNFRVYRSGFPDLTLWNPQTNKIKFVEVKGPNDKLSPNQRVWLHFLRKIGLDCEVCNVKNVSGKNSD